MGNTYLIIGGSSGIGRALVAQLATAGNTVIAMSRNEGDLGSIPGIDFHSLDVTNGDIDPDLLPDTLDGVVYCPGSINLKPFRSLKPENFQEDFEINVLGAVKVLRATEKLLKKSPNASVVLFSTVAVGQGMPFHASVAAAKGAVEGLTKSLAAEWAPKVRVNCIAPSLTDTPMAERLLNSDTKREGAANRHPLKSVGDPSDIAAMAAFLLSSQAKWITGQVLGVDGGMSTVRV